MHWFLKVADIELKNDDLTEIKDQYIPNPNVAEHFVPPRFPPAIWEQIKNSREQKINESDLQPFPTILLPCPQ